MTAGAQHRISAAERMYGGQGWAGKYQRRLFVSDVFVVALVMVGAHAARFGWDPLYRVAGPSAPAYGVVSAVIATMWVIALGATKSREPRVLGHGPQEFQRVVAAGWWTFAVVAIVGFLTQWDLSRGYLIFALPLGTLILLVYRLAWRNWIHAQRDMGRLRAQVLVVGPVRTSEQMIARLTHKPRAGYAVIGACVPEGTDPALRDLEGVPVLGAVSEAVEIAKRANAEFVLMSGTDEVSLGDARRIGWQLEDTGIGLIVAPAMVDVAGPRVLMSPVEGLPLLHVDTAQFHGAKYIAKEIYDRVSAALMLAFIAVPMLAVAAAIKLTSPGPVFFIQQRIGKDGSPFGMYKFRSMVADAERQAADVMGGELTPFYKNEDDPRITPLGRFMRRYSIDELPQLINVLKGDMSMVGPRPQVAAEVAHYGDLARRRLLVKPGMTGLWQVSGRSSLTPAESIRLDAYYAENWSIGGDAVIIMRTIAAVLGSSGAY
ncbi:sugar transferase [Demequina iriomotensis]|uniref:sugar transferase n=1 Tax=Demequina iriomotensis TaxID=1536641 RepID=UPI001470696C|nr:sugar transferase [Demequina iriomotensis]